MVLWCKGIQIYFDYIEIKGVLKKLLLAMSGPYKIRARELPERKILNY